jgi:hypothetical protein
VLRCALVDEGCVCEGQRHPRRLRVYSLIEDLRQPQNALFVIFTPFRHITTALLPSPVYLLLVFSCIFQYPEINSVLI